MKPVTEFTFGRQLTLDDEMRIVEKENCLICQDPNDPTSHRGSPRCRSGSLASGGHRSHCTCSTCF